VSDPLVRTPVSDPLGRAAAAGIHRITLPTPFAIGRVNVYLIEDEPLTLLDTGPNSGEALDELERGLAELGRRVEDLELLVVSHQHMDHLGLVQILARRSGAEIAAIKPLAGFLADFNASAEADDEYAAGLMLQHGIPAEVVWALRALSASFRGWGATATVTRELRDGGDLVLRDRTLRVLRRPGHSPTDTVLHDAERGIMLGADHLLARISSNPLRHRPLDEVQGGLLTYLDSLALTRAMDDVELVLTGHGEPVTDHVALIDERLRGHGRRAEKLHALLVERPRTAYELASALWGGNVAVTQAYLTLSEVLGHLDVLEREGRVRGEREHGVSRFAPTGA
jgi:glyoxylase-like metal-dependent hydrolase (beta-lactamase superfamily II)